jgi:putative ABC transport system permease protein
MSNRSSANTSMFGRLVLRLLFANRGRLFVVLLALSAGAAVSAALLNLQTDAKRRINSEFRSFGPNIIISAHAEKNQSESLFPRTIPESILDNLPPMQGQAPVPAAAFLYGFADISAYGGNLSEVRTGLGRVILAGTRFRGDDIGVVLPHRVLNPDHGATIDADTCNVGARVADQLHLHYGSILKWRSGAEQDGCLVEDIDSFGTPEDDQIFVSLRKVQSLSNAEGRASVIQLAVYRTPGEVDRYCAQLQAQFPDAEVRPLRQFTEAQSRIYSRISGLLTAATAIILVLTALCVLAAMTNIAAERKHDVGMMKAIGGSARGILNLFLTEAVLLGLIGGLIGAAAGIALSMALGKAVFGVAAAPRLIVYPIAVSLTVIVAILGAYPLRRLANVRPATIFRGEA